MPARGSRRNTARRSTRTSKAAATNKGSDKSGNAGSEKKDNTSTVMEALMATIQKAPKTTLNTLRNTIAGMDIIPDAFKELSPDSPFWESATTDKSVSFAFQDQEEQEVDVEATGKLVKALLDTVNKTPKKAQQGLLSTIKDIQKDGGKVAEELTPVLKLNLEDVDDSGEDSEDPDVRITKRNQEAKRAQKEGNQRLQRTKAASFATAAIKQQIANVQKLAPADINNPFKVGEFLDSLEQLRSEACDDSARPMVLNMVKNLATKTLFAKVARVAVNENRSWSEFDKECATLLKRTVLPSNALKAKRNVQQHHFQVYIDGAWDKLMPSLKRDEVLTDFQSRIETGLNQLARVSDLLGMDSIIDDPTIQTNYLVKKLPLEMQKSALNVSTKTCDTIIEHLLQVKEIDSQFKRSLNTRVNQLEQLNRTDEDGFDASPYEDAYDGLDDDDMDRVNAMDMQCYNCSGYGHLSRDCPSPRKAPQGQGRGGPANQQYGPNRLRGGGYQQRRGPYHHQGGANVKPQGIGQFAGQRAQMRGPMTFSQGQQSQQLQFPQGQQQPNAGVQGTQLQTQTGVQGTQNLQVNAALPGVATSSEGASESA